MRRSQIMIWSPLRSLVLGIILIALGIGLSLAAPTRDLKPAQAQAGGDYSATWNATHLLVARLVQPDLTTEQKCETVNSTTKPYGNPANAEVALGPSRWEVKGQLDDGSKFKEIWTTATPPNSITFGEGTWNPLFFGWGRCDDPIKLKIIGNSNQEDWIIGFMQDKSLDKSAMEFRTIGVNDAMTNSNYPDGNVRIIGKTTSCQETNRCLFTTGPYAWTTFHEIDEASNSKYENVGTLIPARWNVTGFLCSVGDNRCN